MFIEFRSASVALTRHAHVAANVLAFALLLALQPTTLAAQGAKPPIASRGPLVVTVHLTGRPVRAGAFRVCVGTARDRQAYGIVATDPSGSARFPDAPSLGELIVSVEAAVSASVMYGATVTHLASPTRRQLTVDVAPNFEVRCPGATRRLMPEILDTTGVVGTLQHTGSPIAVSRNLTFFTTTTNGVRALGVKGFAVEFRTRQDGGAFGEWRRAAVTEGNLLTGVVHQIVGANGRKSVTLQLRNGRFVTSPMYDVTFDFAEIYFCNFQYRRADHALAPSGVPEGSLGLEEVRLSLGERKTFDTAWPSPNEKRRGYGMHLRTATATGDHAVEMTVRRAGVTETITVAPGERKQLQADLMSVRCP